MTRARGELPAPEEALLGIQRPTLEQEQEAERIAAEKAELRKAGLIQLMRQDWFREWLMGWLVQFGAFDNPMAASPTGFPDPMATQFYLGRKAAGWELWAHFDDLSPDLASLMRREASGRG